MIILFPVSARKNVHLCITKWCRKRRKKSHLRCSACVMRIWRKKNPLPAFYASLVARARRSRIAVGCTLAEFRKWAVVSGFFVDGERVRGLTVDRKKAHLGYFIDNMQVLGGSENIAKGNRERHLPAYKKNRWRMGADEIAAGEMQQLQTEPESSDPF